MRKRKLSIVIPVYNSEGTIAKVVNNLIRILEGYKYEIVLVNDGSKDRSEKICKDLTKKFKFIKFINLSKNFGQHSAIMAGLRFSSGDYIISMDDDCQTPPKAIILLINKLKQGYDVVYVKYYNKKYSIFRKIGSRINDLMMNMLLNKPKGISTSSNFILKRYIAEEILNYIGPYPYISGLIFRVTDNIANIELEHAKREKGKSNYNLFKLFKLWINGFTNFSVKPLRASFLIGCLLSAISFILVIVFIIRKFTDPNIFLGWTSILVAILFFSGIQLITMGLLGEYIGRIFLSQNKLPQYVIKEKLSNDSLEK